MDNLTSRVISFIRFPMIAAVVAIHCNFIIVNPELESRYLFSILFSITLKLIWVSVPIFFFISGLLFFKEGTFNISLYKSKLRKRFYTIFIPYIIWNIIYFCIVCLQQFFKPDLLLLLHKRIIDFNWTDYRPCSVRWSTCCTSQGDYSLRTEEQRQGRDRKVKTKNNNNYGHLRNRVRLSSQRDNKWS